METIPTTSRSLDQMCIRDSSSEEDVYNFIISDLDSAATLLPITQEEVGRATKGADVYKRQDKLIAKDLQLLIDMVVNEMPPKRKMIYKLSRIKGVFMPIPVLLQLRLRNIFKWPL